jgi:hypothetical protein
VRIRIRKYRIGAVNSAISVANFAATDLGIISPKVRIKNVIIPVAIPTPSGPNWLVIKNVIIADDPTFTILFPIRIVIISFSGFDFSFFTKFIPVLPFLISASILASLREKNAVSEEEKNPERIIETTIIVSVNILL